MLDVNPSYVFRGSHKISGYHVHGRIWPWGSGGSLQGPGSSRADRREPITGMERESCRWMSGRAGSGTTILLGGKAGEGQRRAVSSKVTSWRVQEWLSAIRTLVLMADPGRCPRYATW